MVKDTSILSYISLLEKNNLSKNQKIIFDVIKLFDEGVSNRFIAKFLGWDINCVTGRTRELVLYGFVKEGKIVYDDETKRSVTLWVKSC